MSKICYLCARAFDGAATRQHGERIIQNAIAGALVSDDILCEQCGVKLGDSVDAAFATALSPLTVLLELARDRGDYSQTTAKLVPNDPDAAPLQSLQFTLHSDFSVVPHRPAFLRSEARKTVTVIGATSKQAAQYAKASPVRAALDGEYALELSTNAAPFAQNLLVPVGPNSVEVLRGVLKIAIGYASFKGVLRETFEHLLEKDDLTNSEPLLQSTVFPYYPTTDAERLFETEKHTHEDWYPTHHLYLFSQGTSLYCYVELFGAIQKYVHLTDGYAGPPLMEKFVQRVEKWGFDESIYTAGSPKDLHILAGEWDVEMAGRPWEDVQRDVLNRARARTYALEPDETIEKVGKLVGLLVQFSFLKNEEALRIEVVKSMFGKADIAKTNLGLSLVDELKANPMSALPLVRKTYEDFRMGDVGASCPEQARAVTAADLEKYIAYKCYELLRAKKRESVLEYHLL